MSALTMPQDPRRLLIVLPNWVGDVVMASPVLSAVRSHFGDAKITFLMRRYVREIVEGCAWHDEERFWPAGGGWKSIRETRDLIRDLRGEGFDAALLLTNSFRSAFIVWAARVPQRIGYARDGRSLLLTERLKPLKRDGEFVPTQLLPCYMALAERIGLAVADRRLRLGVSEAQEQLGWELLARYGLLKPEAAPHPALSPQKLGEGANGRRRAATAYAVINPGAAFGAAKCWLPERFAEVCDRLHEERGLRCVIVGASGELPLMRRIAELAMTRPIVFDDPPTTLGSLKVVIREAALLVCNDTGPRHYGNAFGVPTVTIFGPTHQEWTLTDYARETRLQAKVECGPCQLPACPLDHRCMKNVTADMVVNAATSQLTS